MELYYGYIMILKEGIWKMAAKDYLILITSQSLGSGAEELGKKLMGSYIYTLAQIEAVEKLPTHILFINSGVYLVTGESNSLDELKELEKKGVKILACGTCLNYFALEDKIEVGEVSNMQLNVELLTETDKVISIN